MIVEKLLESSFYTTEVLSTVLVPPMAAQITMDKYDNEFYARYRILKSCDKAFSPILLLHWWKSWDCLAQLRGHFSNIDKRMYCTFAFFLCTLFQTYRGVATIRLAIACSSRGYKPGVRKIEVLGRPRLTTYICGIAHTSKMKVIIPGTLPQMLSWGVCHNFLRHMSEFVSSHNHRYLNIPKGRT